MNIDHLFIIDIETVPAYINYDALPETDAYLWSKKANSYFVNEKTTVAQAYDQRAGIMAEFGKIICIGTSFFIKDNDGKLTLKQKTIYSDDEHELLENFIEICDKFITVRKDINFAGHNIKEFDIPYLCRRMLANQVSIPAYMDFQNKKPWETNLFDTLHWWRFGDYKNYTSLDLIAHTLGIPSSKDDIDGSMVSKVYYQDNDLLRIAKYCAKDVVVVAQLIMRYLNKPLLNPNEIVSQ